jgi:hypothetical protein
MAPEHLSPRPVEWFKCNRWDQDSGIWIGPGPTHARPALAHSAAHVRRRDWPADRAIEAERDPSPRIGFRTGPGRSRKQATGNSVLAPQDLDAQHRGKLFPVNESAAAPQSLPAGVSDFSNSGKTRGGKDRSLFGQDRAAAENRQRATMQMPQGLDAQHRGELFPVAFPAPARCGGSGKVWMRPPELVSPHPMPPTPFATREKPGADRPG